MCVWVSISVHIYIEPINVQSKIWEMLLWSGRQHLNIEIAHLYQLKLYVEELQIEIMLTRQRWRESGSMKVHSEQTVKASDVVAPPPFGCPDLTDSSARPISCTKRTNDRQKFACPRGDWVEGARAHERVCIIRSAAQTAGRTRASPLLSPRCAQHPFQNNRFWDITDISHTVK